ncbi:MAG: Gfo/Idh/MocA family oxidoreductase [Chloroflexi bacterium]|nr:Gfo/Idh/MocA family oxidoreductase [Chloroflexota bacterium]MCL5273544.1 Gfo/Idh/MocA family oxidoreductase [Chloroflexota bacterium]
METYRIGVIGAGFMGHVHSYCWTVIPFFYKNPGFKVALKAVCTSRQETADAAREELGFEKSYSDMLALIDDPEVDIIDIATPNHLHKNALLAAHSAGKRVYCDKPLTGNLEQALELERQIPSLASLGQMTLQYRFFPATMRAQRMIDNGVLGDVISFRVAYLHSGNVAAGKRMNWKDSRESGAGVLYDLGSHAIDLLTWLCGSELAEVFAHQKTLHRLRPSAQDPTIMAEQDSDDMTAIVAALANGALGTVEVSKIATGAQDELRFEIHGTKGALRFNLMQPNYLDHFDLADPELPLGGTSGFKRIHCLQRYEAPAGFPGPKFSVGWLRGHLHCLYTFIDAVHTGKPFDPSIARGIELEKWLAQIDQSASSGQPVRIAP